MRKYAVNYSRSFPDHRTTNDFKAYEQIRLNPTVAFRVYLTLLRHGKQELVITSPNTSKSILAQSLLVSCL